MEFKTLLKICYVLAFYFDFNVGNKKNLLSKKTAPTNPIQIALVWFGSDFILKVNRTKPNRILIYLSVWMTFNLKTE